MIKAYCNETIQVIRDAAPGDWLEPEETEEEDVEAYVDWTNELVRNQEGEEVTSSVSVYMEYDNTLGYADKLRIQDIPHSIIKISRLQDFSAVCLRVWCS